MLSPQEIFDRVAQHLVTQGMRSMTMNPENSDLPAICSYKNPDGLKCAVGVLIPDAVYAPEMEGRAICTVSRLFDSGYAEEGTNLLGQALLDVGVDIRDENVSALLQRLQDIHDEGEVSLWPEALKAAADDYRLTYTPAAAA